ncbi:unnamed protein product [Closterium sp. Yama58-4]|nr:unnamed protein product [Closterium sp. Yama58-4]
MGTLVKPQLAAVPLLLFLVIGTCTAAHPWRRALVRDDEDAVSWNAGAYTTNEPNAPRGIHAKAATFTHEVSEPLMFSASGGGAGSHATPSWNQHATASRVATAAPHAAPHAARHTVQYAPTPGASRAARNSVNHGSHGFGNSELHESAANQRRDGASRHDGGGNGGSVAINDAFRAASADDVAIHHRSSHERRSRGDRSRGAPVGWNFQRNNGGAYNGALAPPFWNLNSDRRGEFRMAGASDVEIHRRNGGSNRNDAQGANNLRSYQHGDGVNHGGMRMASAHTNAAGDYGGDYNAGDNGGDYNAGDNGGDYNVGDNGGDYNAGDNGGDYNAGDNGGDYNAGDNGGDYNAGDNGGDYNAGDNGGDYNAGDNGGDYNGGDNGSDYNGGDNGGDYNGGDNGATAQDYANQLASRGCPLEHSKTEGLGQNLYWLSPAGLTPQEDRGAVQSWVEEKADWTPSPIPDGCADGKMCGHYTQVVWRDTTHVGCGSAQCPDGAGMWVCNYSPPGNFVGQTPF